MKSLKIILIITIFLMILLNVTALTQQDIEASVNITNSPPDALSVTISPKPAQASNNLTGSYTYSDLENHSESGTEFDWWINGISTGYNTELLLSGNLSGSDIVKFSVKPCDIYSCGDWTNSSPLTIGDTEAPLFSGQYVTPTSPEINTPVNIYINVSDTGSGIEYVRVTLIDPNEQQYIFAMTNDVGNRYVKTYIPAIVGTYQITNFTMEDTSGNFNYTESSLTFNAVYTPEGGGGGSGGTILQEVIVGAGNESFKFLTETRSKFYDLNMPKKSSRTRRLVVENTGTLVSNYTLNCVGVLCQYLTFSEERIKLFPNEVKEIDMTIDIPFEIEYNKQYLADLEMTNDFGNKEKVNVKVTTSQYIGAFLQFLEKLRTSTDLTSWFGISKFNPDAKPLKMPNILILLIFLIGFLVGTQYLLKKGLLKDLVQPIGSFILLLLILVILP